jgi:hypothetical protein
MVTGLASAIIMCGHHRRHWHRSLRKMATLRWLKDTRIFGENPAGGTKTRVKFSALMRKVEAVRFRDGISKKELAAALETTTDALRAWMSGRTVGRKETVAKIKDFLKRESN